MRLQWNYSDKIVSIPWNNAESLEMALSLLSSLQPDTNSQQFLNYKLEMGFQFFETVRSCKDSGQENNGNMKPQNILVCQKFIDP